MPSWWEGSTQLTSSDTYSITRWLHIKEDQQKLDFTPKPKPDTVTHRALSYLLEWFRVLSNTWPDGVTSVHILWVTLSLCRNGLYTLNTPSPVLGCNDTKISKMSHLFWDAYRVAEVSAMRPHLPYLECPAFRHHSVIGRKVPVSHVPNIWSQSPLLSQAAWEKGNVKQSTPQRNGGLSAALWLKNDTVTHLLNLWLPSSSSFF